MIITPLIPVYPYDLFHMYKFQIKITEIQLLKWNSEMISESKLTMQGKMLGLYTDRWIEPFVEGLNYESRYSRELCLFSTLHRPYLDWQIEEMVLNIWI